MNKYFLSISLILALSLWSESSAAQADKANRPSPFVQIEGTIDQAVVVIQYSAPAVKGRTIWGSLVPYDKVWRTGANEATTFEVSEDCLIQGELLPAGKYALFSIPGETEWTWIFNEVWDQWGAFKYNESSDVLRVKSTPEFSPVFHEQLTLSIEENTISLSWDNLQIKLN